MKRILKRPFRKSFIIHESNISYENNDKWIKYDGRGQPVSDDIIVNYTYFNNSHIINTNKASEIDWCGINFYKIVKVGNIKPDINNWIKYDGKGQPVRDDIKIDFKWAVITDNSLDKSKKLITRGYEFNVSALTIGWNLVTHYRISKL